VSDSRRLVYVSGAPGSGKTSLAVPLAAELGYPLLAKDRIKETLHDALGAPGPTGRGHASSAVPRWNCSAS
jgi:predicted kinase